jgi:phosphoribosyl 1,2-cyclic phosphate phosphodiesterase
MICPPLQVSFLGTGTSGGVPMIACDCVVCSSEDPRDKRLRSSILVRSATTTLVVDTGPDFRYQMLRKKVRHLDAVLFTHPHKDHLAGLDDIRAYNHFGQKPMQVFADSLTEEALRRDFYYAFSETRYPGIPELQLQTITESAFWVGDIPVQPIQVWHHRMPVLGFRFGHFTYITDANRIEEEEMQKIRGSRVLVLNALRKEEHLSHFTLAQAVSLIGQLEVPKGYLTHLSHQMGLHASVSDELPAGVELSYDGLELSFPEKL